MALERPGSARYDDVISDAVIGIVRTSGVQSLTLPNIAAFLRVSPPALINRYGSRERVLSVALDLVAYRWSVETERRWRWAQRATHERAAALATLFPPADEADDLRVWLAIAAYMRSDPARRHLLDEAHQRERDLVAAVLDPGHVDLVLATIHGLRHAVADPQDFLDREGAVRLLTHLIVALDAPSTDRAA